MSETRQPSEVASETGRSIDSYTALVKEFAAANIPCTLRVMYGHTRLSMPVSDGEKVGQAVRIAEGRGFTYAIQEWWVVFR